MTQAERALAKLSAAAARASAELSSCHAAADLLPLSIGRQLADAVELVDYLRFMVHEATLRVAIHGPSGLTASPAEVEEEAPKPARKRGRTRG